MSVQAGNNVLSPFNKNRLFEDLPTYYRTKQCSNILRLRKTSSFSWDISSIYHYKNATLLNIKHLHDNPNPILHQFVFVQPNQYYY